MMLSNISRKIMVVANRKGVDDALSSGLALADINLNDGYISFVLYDPSMILELLSKEGKFLKRDKLNRYTEIFADKAIIAAITLYKDGESYRVASVAARSGYGPMMYEVASKQLGWIRPDNNVSDSAKRVWFKFYERDDIKRRAESDVADYLSNSYRVPYTINYKPLIKVHASIQKELKRRHELHPGSFSLMLSRAGTSFFQDMI